MGQLREKYKEHFITLCEAGFIAVNQADEDSALKLFRAALMLKPTNMLPRVGLGYLHLCKLELGQASKCFAEVLQKEPDNEMAKTFLGLALALAPTETAKGEKLLEDSARSSKDPEIKSLAKNAFDFVQKFVKKATSPVHVQNEKKKK
jgi:Tfp pilus assembly protein PilF